MVHSWPNGYPFIMYQNSIQSVIDRNFKTASTPIGSFEHLESTMDIQLRLAQLAQSCLQRNFFNWLVCKVIDTKQYKYLISNLSVKKTDHFSSAMMPVLRSSFLVFIQMCFPSLIQRYSIASQCLYYLVSIPLNVCTMYHWHYSENDILPIGGFLILQCNQNHKHL